MFQTGTRLGEFEILGRTGQGNHCLNVQGFSLCARAVLAGIFRRLPLPPARRSERAFGETVTVTTGLHSPVGVLSSKKHPKTIGLSLPEKL